jgi:hypothetical protein
MADFKVFISGVTSEVGAAREKVAARLQELKLETKEQKDFTHGLYSDTTLKRLHDYIVDCAAVVCIIGKRSGDKPSPKASAPFARMLPEGFAEASYTQWEWLFALHYERPLLIFYASDDFKPDQLAPNGPDYFDLQEAYRDYLFKKLGRYRKPFSNVDQLCDEVLKVNWGALWITHGWSQEKAFAPFLKERSIFFFGRDWLFNDINAWRGDERHGERMFLVTGTPGIGKSAVVARFLGQKPCGSILAYHCFLHTEKDTTQLGGFVRNVAFQLAQNIRSYREILVRPDMKQTLRELDASPDEGPGQFFRNAIFGKLQTLEKPTEIADGPAWIVVDALDEAVAAGDPDYDKKRQQITGLIEAALKLLPPWLRIFATSRRDDLTERLGRMFENGRPFVRQIYLDDEKRMEDANMYRDYIAKRLEDGPQLSNDAMSHLINQSEGNFLYLKLVLDQIVAGAYGVKDIKALPRGLPFFYTQNFERLYPEPDEDELQNAVRPVLAALAVTRTPLTSECLARVTELPALKLRRVLERLEAYLPKPQGKYRLFHKSFADWLLDPETPRHYAIAETEGHALLARYCWNSFDALHERADEVTDLENDADWDYLIRYGIDHLLEAGSIAQAVRLLHFILIEKKWDEERISESSFKDVAPRVFTRWTLRALRECPAEEKPKIEPYDLEPLLEDFYQVEPLGPPIAILVREHPEAWKKDILQKFLDAGNYVLRYAISEVLAKVCTERKAAVTLDEIYDYLDHPDINLRELGVYTLRHLYGRDPGLMKLEYVERMGDSDTYAARSALGDLLLNLVFQKRFDIARVKSRVFWEPIWDHNRIDVWDLKAAVPFLAKEPLPEDADDGTRTAYANFQRTEEMRLALLDNPEIQDSAAIRGLVTDFFILGRNPDRISFAEEDLADSPHLTALMRLFFSHPLWNVAEVAASALEAMIQTDNGKQAIVFALFDDPYWRVRFGAVETAYQHAEVDRNALFGTAVKRFYRDENSRVRALCAENLIAYILERPTIRRKQLLKDFAEAIDAWIRDDDAWVLEHVFRLLNTLERDDKDFDCGTLFAPQMPYLLDGLPRSGWRDLSRAEFLTHIEAQQRKQH